MWYATGYVTQAGRWVPWGNPLPLGDGSREMAEATATRYLPEDAAGASSVLKYVSGSKPDKEAEEIALASTPAAPGRNLLDPLPGPVVPVPLPGLDQNPRTPPPVVDLPRPALDPITSEPVPETRFYSPPPPQAPPEKPPDLARHFPSTRRPQAAAPNLPDDPSWQGWTPTLLYAPQVDAPTPQAPAPNLPGDPSWQGERVPYAFDPGRVPSPPVVGNVFIKDYSEWSTPDLERQVKIGDENARAELLRRNPPLLVPMVDQAPRWDPAPPPVQEENPIKTFDQWLAALGPTAYQEKPRPAAPPVVESKRELGLHSAPDLTVYDDAGLEELCYRYGDQASCSELARRSGLRTDKPDVTRPVDSKPKPPLPPIGNPVDDMATLTDRTPSNPDGSPAGVPTRSEPIKTGIGYVDALLNDKDIIKFRDVIAGWFAPRDGETSPSNTAGGKASKEVPWYQSIPSWVWLLVGGLGVYAVTRRR